MDSILDSIKAQLGLEPDYDAFDNEIVIHVNSVFLILNQLGVGPAYPFYITGRTETWDEFFGDNIPILLVKSYMYLKVKILFDPPNSGVLHEALERQIEEFEWRLNVQAETPAYDGFIDGDLEGGDDYDDEEWDRHHYD